MARPTTKAELIAAASTEFEKLQTLVDGLTDTELNTPFNFSDDPKRKEAHWNRDQNLRDVFIHLYEWHQLLLVWVAANMANAANATNAANASGSAVPFLPEPYNWKTYGDMNVEFWQKHQSTSYDDSKAMLIASYEQVLALANTLTDEELFTKKHFNWTGTTTLGSYFISSTSSHYDWASKKIKAHQKALKN
jgi:hypothetical protein